MKSIFIYKTLLFFIISLQILAKSPLSQQFHWKIVTVQDSEDSLPYETNGAGPAYHEDDMRFSEATESEPPHPDMPDQEPRILGEMEEKLSKLMGSPRDARKKQPGNLSLDALELNFKDPHLIQQDFRFAQIASDTSLSQKDKELLTSTSGQELHTIWDTVDFSSAWASSVYTYRWWWYYHSYPASNAIGNGWSYWCSTGGHSQDQVVTWQGDFDKIRRIYYLWIRWAYAPGWLSVQTTNDGKTWEERIPWREAARSKAASGRKILFWFWRYEDRSYPERVQFDEPIWVSGVRILMKDPMFYYYGIYQVKAWTKQWLVQLKSGQNLDSDDCLVVNDGIAGNGALLAVRNCIDAIQQGDARELFVLQNNLQITSQNQDFCIESSNGDLSENSRIQLYNCRLILAYSGGDNREKWLLDPKGYMKILKNPDKCLTIKNEDIEPQKDGSIAASASSTLNDGQHDAKLAVNGDENAFWASEPGVQQVEYKLSFSPATVKELQIKLQYLAKKFEVLCFLNGYWRSFASYNGNEEEEVKVNTGSNYISGIKILFFEADDKAKFNDKLIYGIKSVKIKSGARPVHLKDCNSEADSQLNKWFVDDSEFVDISTRPTYNAEFKKLYDNTNRLLDIVHSLMAWPPKIQEMIEKAKLIAAQIAKTENDINTLDLKLEQFKSEYLVEEQEMKKDSGLGTVGSSSVRPAVSCAYIKQLFPYKMTGYYWLQPDCARVPIRSFCDFTNSEFGLDYTYYGGLGDSILDKKIKSLDDVKYYCAKMGLQPVELKSKAQLLLIHRYLGDIGVNLQSNGFIPLGFDYGCQQQSCTGHYSSLNRRSSNDITEILTSMIDQKNVLMQGFAKLFNSKPDYLIGFGLSKTGAMTSKFESKVPIKGIVCSTNKEKSEDDSSWIKADCETKARGNSEFDGEINTNLKVICPSGCSNRGNGKVYGTSTFRDDSSVCKAAIHNGIINDDKGGKVNIGIIEGKDKYLGSDAFGIKSETYEGKWDRSFTTTQYKIVCPMDNYKNYHAPSFLQLDEEFSHFSGFGNNLANSLRNDIDTANKTLNSLTNTNNNHKNNTDSSSSSLIKTSGNDNEDSEGSGQTNKNENGGGASTENTKLGGQLDSTEQAIEKLIGLYDLDRDDLAKQVRLVKDSHALLEKFESEYGPMVNSDYSPDYQSKYIETLLLHLKGSGIEVDKTIALAASKLKRIEKKLRELKLEKLKYQKYEPYTEKYDLELADMYETNDLAQSLNKPSKWYFSKASLNGHATAIAQTSNIQISGDTKERPASLLRLKSKNYYDGRIAVSVLAKDTGRIGIVFRYLDQFNYYVFEMQRGTTDSGYKRIRKFVNGEPTVLRTENDGGYLQDKWYRVIVEFALGKFVVKMEEESEKNLLEDYEGQMTKVLEAYDGDFAQGGFGFTVNAMAGVYFDNFSVKPLKCVDQNLKTTEQLFMPPSCNRFKENFYADINFVWTPKDPENNKNGPSTWQYQADYQGKNHAIVQTSLIMSPDSTHPPALLELKLQKICDKGLIQTEIFSEESSSNSYVGVAFHYQNSKNYMIFQLFGGEKPYCQVKKVSDGSIKVLQKTEDSKKCGLESKKWLSISIKLAKTEWVFYLAKSENEGLEEVLKVEADSEMQHGSFALATFAMKAGFTNIKSMPLEDFEFKGLPSNVVEVENNEVADTQQKDQEENPKVKKNSEKTAEYEGCLDKKSPEMREKYCMAKFLDDKAAQNDCKTNFCDRCCEDNIDSIHTMKRFKCKRTCKGLTQNEKDSDAWQLCVASPRPTVSVYQYCEINQENAAEKQRCKIDFCNLCCTVSDEVFKKKFADDLVDKCHKNCMDNFADNTDVVVKN